MSSVFSRVLGAFGVPREFWSRLVGSSDRQMAQWMAGQRELPYSVAVTLSQATGVPAEVLLSSDKAPHDLESILPPLWLKARESGLGEAEYRAIALARLLATRHDELLALTASPPGNYRLLFNEIKERVDPQQPAAAQGVQAAAAFLELTGLGKGATGIGEVIRGHLRARGILVVETPINNRRLEGFCVPVGGAGRVRPCIVANSYRTTWFRRNEVILHELCHGIFDVEASSAVFDAGAPVDEGAIGEQRANAFAMNALIPKRLLVASENRGFRLKELTADQLAELIAEVHAEQRLIVRAARDYGMISPENEAYLASLDVAQALRERSHHARGLQAVPSAHIHYPDILVWGNRLTTFPTAGLRLPIPFVRAVLEALAEGQITRGRAAELLMVREEEMATRFRIATSPAAEDELLAPA